MDDDENRLHVTAVAQVFAFIVQALRAEPCPSSWHDAALTLDTWAVQYDDVLRKTPETTRNTQWQESARLCLQTLTLADSDTVPVQAS